MPTGVWLWAARLPHRHWRVRSHGTDGNAPPFLGWTPRNQWGFHLRRVGGQLFFPGPSIVPERPDGRMKPGELQSGGYGFYYKGHQQAQPVQQRDVLQDLQAVITPMVIRPAQRRTGTTVQGAYSLSGLFFSNEKWAECLASHGLVVDADRRTLTVQSESVQADMVYDLTEEEVKALVAAPIEEQPVEKRLKLLNGIIGADFSDKVTMEALNSDQRIAIGLHPEVQQDLEQRQRQEQEAFMPVETSLQQQEESIQGDIGAAVDGRDLLFLNENKGWYREEKHGREVEVSQIAVQPAQTEGKYRMTAVIDGQAISHEITQRDYDKFLAVDDYHRMKLFSKIFSEVDMKTRPEAQRGLGTKILAALTAGGGSLRVSHTASIITAMPRSSTASVSAVRHARISSRVSIRRGMWPSVVSRQR